MAGQAESAPESGGLNDLADFLDTPEEESEEENTAENAEESTGDADNDTDANGEQGDEEAEASEEGEAEEEPASADKITFKVKGEDGTEETVEATPEELASSYMRQKDYTKKTQALAARENEAVQILAKKHEEIRDHYLTQAQLTRAAIVNMAGLKSEEEMAQLANSDPVAWVAESQRQKAITSYLNQLGQQIEGEKQHATTQQEQAAQARNAKMFEDSWAVLQKDGIDKPKLQKIYGEVSKSYGFTDAELGGVLDHRMVKVMKDAVAYRELQAQKATVTKKVQDAPRMPNRQAGGAQERRDKALDAKFKSGRAKLNDLAAFLN